MTRGGPKKPTALKRAEGNPGKRPLNDREPKPKPASPRCPAWLDAESVVEWRRVVPELSRMGLLTKVDIGTLVSHCQTWSMFVASAKSLGNCEYGSLEYQKAFRNVLESSKAMLRFGQEFGLTPASRSNLSTPKCDDQDLDAFMEENRPRLRINKSG